MAEAQERSTAQVPLLPAPQQASTDGTTKLDVGGTAVKLDDFGPMVVNSDGTLSRISNWENMTQSERERTLRLLSKRNQLRLANEEKKLDGSQNPEDQRVLALTKSDTSSLQ